MEKYVKMIALYSLLTLIMVVAIGVIVYQGDVKQSVKEVLGGQAGTIIELVGSRVGTTTTAVAFTDNSATSTYPLEIGREYDTVDFSIKTTAYGAGGDNNAKFSVLGSNDFDCDTASTSTSFISTVLTSDINWFDISSHIANLAGSKTLNAGTSTIAWYPTAIEQGTVLTLENLNTRCLALQVSASGTSLFIQAQKKKFK